MRPTEVQLTLLCGDKHDLFTVWLLRRWKHLEDVLNVLQEALPADHLRSYALCLAR